MTDIISAASSDKKRDTRPIVTNSELVDLAQGNSAFARHPQGLRQRRRGGHGSGRGHGYQ